MTVKVGPFGGTVSADGTTAYGFDSKTGLLVNPLSTGAAESVCPSCYLVGGTALFKASSGLRGFISGRAFSDFFRTGPTVVSNQFV